MLHALIELTLDLEQWPEDSAAHVRTLLARQPDIVAQIIGQGPRAGAKAGWVKFFLQEVLGCRDVCLPRVCKRKRENTEADDGRDLHRISSEDLERIYGEARNNPLDELLFMLMLTTGLRIGGVAGLTVTNVADIKNGKYIVRAQGRTREKGNKMASFVLCPDVQRLLRVWLAEGRRGDNGAYLFPGVSPGSHISTDSLRRRFKALCSRCGLQGTEFHPHALRHTNAHILLECGNSADIVSKCLNHSSVAVTQQFYLKESGAEVQSRCNAPWLQMETPEERERKALAALPSLLGPDARSTAAASATPVEDERKSRKRAAKTELLKSLLQPP